MAFASGLTFLLKAFSRRAVPEYDGSHFAGVEGVGLDAKIVRDADGTPTCFASDEKSVFFLNGVCQGQDRLWQLHISRMAALGRVCEVAGKKALQVDVMVRQIGLPSVARGDFEHLKQVAEGKREDSALCPEEASKVVDMLEYFAKGVNWAARNCRQLPIEFHITGQRPWEPWTATHSLAVARLHGFAMCFGSQHAILRQALYEALGPEAASEFTSTEDREANLPYCCPPYDSKLSAELAKADIASALNIGQEKGDGSNVFVVSGEFTASQKPILASDPHLRVKIPGFWYQINLHCKAKAEEDSFVVAGAGSVGLPAVFIGHNGTCAWGITLGYCDVEDIFVERLRRTADGKCESLLDGEWVPCRTSVEELRVKGQREPERFVRVETVHGPVLSFPSLQEYGKLAEAGVGSLAGSSSSDYEVAVSYQGLPIRPRSCSVVGIRRFVRVTDFREFDQALSFVSRSICLNFAYADTNGHLGWVLTGEVPIRQTKPGEEMFPLKGWESRSKHQGYTPHANMPKTLDPKKGFVISTNNKVVDYEDFKHYLGYCFKAGFRARAIESELKRLTSEGRKLTVEDIRGLQQNVQSVPAKEFCEILKATLSPLSDAEISAHFSKEELKDGALERVKEGLVLCSFDGVLTKESSSATLYQLTHSQLVLDLLRLWPNDNNLEAKQNRSRVTEIFSTSLFQRIIDGKGFDNAKALKLVNEFDGHVHLNILKMIRGGEKSWWIRTAGGLGKSLSRALAAAVSKFTQISDKRWGTAHRFTIQHPFTAALGLPEGYGLDGPTLRMGGDINTIAMSKLESFTDLRTGGATVSMRFLADMSNLRDNCRLITPVGMCAVLGSPFYTNRAERWASGEVPKLVWAEEDVLLAAVHTLRFDQPSPPQSGRRNSYLLWASAAIIAGIAVSQWRWLRMLPAGYR